MGISPFQLLVVLLIVVLIFGGKRLRTLGSDLGSAIKGFKNEMKSDEDTSQTQQRVGHEKTVESVIDAEVSSKDKIV